MIIQIERDERRLAEIAANREANISAVKCGLLLIAFTAVCTIGIPLLMLKFL